MDTSANTAGEKPSLVDRTKAKVHSVVDKVSHPGHKEDKQVHKEAEGYHKETAGNKAHDAVQDMKQAAGHAKDAVFHSKEKNKHEAGEKIHNTRASAADRMDPNTNTGATGHSTDNTASVGPPAY